MKRLAVRLIGALVGACAAVAPVRAAHPTLPYRFLVVVNDQWADPASEIIEDPSEFSMSCALLKSWGLPFDIYRLDQQRFDAYHLLDRSGRSLYGTIVWDAPHASLSPDAVGLLRALVREQGVGLVAFSDCVLTPVIAELTGTEPTGHYSSAEGLVVASGHFVTRGIPTDPLPPIVASKLLRNRWTASEREPIAGTAAVPADSTATVLARRGGHPAAIARNWQGAGKAVWLDVDRATGQLYRRRWRELFKRALVWTNGYAVCAEYPHAVILSMDDMGAADKTFYPEWHYQTLSEDVIRTRIIAPLERHHAVMDENVVPGFVDRRTRRILNPWRQRVVDELDPTITDDYASTKRGLDAGLKAGVLEIQSHGYTHMVPDLDSAPGPFWSADPRGRVVALNWYKEFGDYIRKAEIPASVQRVHLRRGIQALEHDFGIRPVSLICGGGFSSHTLANNTLRLAAEMGFGLVQSESTCYISHELCLTLEPIMPRVQWQYDQPLSAAEMPWTTDAPVFLGFHDRDVALDPTSVERLLTSLGPGVRYMTFGEYCAYLHVTITRDAESGNALMLKVDYDPAYCDFFRRHASTWVLYVSDEMRKQSNVSASERRLIRFDAGSMSHMIQP